MAAKREAKRQEKELRERKEARERAEAKQKAEEKANVMLMTDRIMNLFACGVSCGQTDSALNGPDNELSAVKKNADIAAVLDGTLSAY